MKRQLLLVSVAAVCSVMSAQIVAPQVQWGAILHSNTTGDQASAVALSADRAYWLTTMGSTAAAPDIMLNDDVLFQGEPYTSGSSQTNNLCLLATDATGAKQWVISSTAGDFASGQGNVATDSEGNVIFTAKVRHGDNLATPISITDAAGTTVTMGGAVERRSYAVLIAKANKDGQLLWHKYITLSTAPSAAATVDFISDAVKVPALTVDNQGCIYVGGNFSADMKVDDNTTINATNISSWSGDSQVSSGSMFVLKLDKDGNYLMSAVASDGVSQAQVTNLEWADDALYVLGNATGEGSCSFAGATITPSGFQSLVAAKLTSDLNADWLRCMPGEDVAGACVMQTPGLTISGPAIWIAGQFNGKFSESAGSDKYIASEGKTPREGCIIKLSTADGSWMAATTSRNDDFTPAIARTGLTGYLKIIQNPAEPSKCYAFGYVMNAAVGVVLREYDAEILTANLDNAWSVATQGGVPTAIGAAYYAENNEIYIEARGNKAFVLAGDPAVETLNPRSWSVLMAKYKLPMGSSGIVSAIADTDTEAEYFNLQGMKVDACNLAPGIYIKHTGTKSVKTIIR